MTLKQRIVAALLRLYPARWRREYGPELVDMLVARPLSARIMSDVVWNGLVQRVRAAEPSTILGLAMMFVVLVGFASNIADPPPYRSGITALLQESSKTLPTVTMEPLKSELYVLVLIVCGCWTQVRFGSQRSAGLAAMRMSLIAGVPVGLAGISILLGVLHIVVVGPGDTTTTFLEHGFTYTYYSAEHRAPSALAIVVSPLFRLGESWIWGAIGGWLARKMLQSQRTPVPSS